VDHARLLVELRGERGGLQDLRKHTGWYLTGYPVGGDVRRTLATIDSLGHLEEVVAGFDPDLAPRPETVGGPRGTQSGPQAVTLPAHWARDRDDSTPPPTPAGALVSGG